MMILTIPIMPKGARGPAWKRKHLVWNLSYYCWLPYVSTPPQHGPVIVTCLRGARCGCMGAVTPKGSMPNDPNIALICCLWAANGSLEEIIGDVEKILFVMIFCFSKLGAAEWAWLVHGVWLKATGKLMKGVRLFYRTVRHNHVGVRS